MCARSKPGLEGLRFQVWSVAELLSTPKGLCIPGLEELLSMQRQGALHLLGLQETVCVPLWGFEDNILQNKPRQGH